MQNATGAVMGPLESFLCSRGLKTLELRVREQCRTAQRLAEWLAGHTARRARALSRPAESSRPRDCPPADGRRLRRDAHLRGRAATSRPPSEFVESTKLFQLAVSLGAVESLIEQPASMSHASYDAADRAKHGITDGLIRLSVGLEAFEDLQADLEQAFAAHLIEHGSARLQISRPVSDRMANRRMTMQLGFVTAIFGDLSFEQVLKHAAEIGYDCVEVMCWPPGVRRPQVRRRHAPRLHRVHAGAGRRRARRCARSTASRFRRSATTPTRCRTTTTRPRPRSAHIRKVIDAAVLLELPGINTFIGANQHAAARRQSAAVRGGVARHRALRRGPQHRASASRTARCCSPRAGRSAGTWPARRPSGGGCSRSFRRRTSG